MNKIDSPTESISFKLDNKRKKFPLDKNSEIFINNNSLFLRKILSIKNQSLLEETLKNSKSDKFINLNSSSYLQHSFRNKEKEISISRNNTYFFNNKYLLNSNNPYINSNLNYYYPENFSPKIRVNKKKFLGNYIQKEKESTKTNINKNNNCHFERILKRRIIKKVKSNKNQFINKDLSPSSLYKNGFFRKPVIFKFENDFNINNKYNNSIIYNNIYNNSYENIKSKEEDSGKLNTINIFKSELYRNYKDLEIKYLEISKRKMRKKLSFKMNCLQKSKDLDDIKHSLEEIKNSKSLNKIIDNDRNHKIINNSFNKKIKLAQKKYDANDKKINNIENKVNNKFEKNKSEILDYKNNKKNKIIKLNKNNNIFKLDNNYKKQENKKINRNGRGNKTPVIQKKFFEDYNRNNKIFSNYFNLYISKSTNEIKKQNKKKYSTKSNKNDKTILPSILEEEEKIKNKNIKQKIIKLELFKAFKILSKIIKLKHKNLLKEEFKKLKFFTKNKEKNDNTLRNINDKFSENKYIKKIVAKSRNRNKEDNSSFEKEENLSLRNNLINSNSVDVEYHKKIIFKTKKTNAFERYENYKYFTDKLRMNLIKYSFIRTKGKIKK